MKIFCKSDYSALALRGGRSEANPPSTNQTCSLFKKKRVK